MYFWCGSMSGNQALLTCTMIRCPCESMVPQCRSIAYPRPAGHDRLRLLEALAEPCPERLPADEQLIPAHVRLVGVVLGVDINQSHHPVTVGSGRGGEQPGHHRSSDDHVRGKWLRLVGEHVRPAVREALVLHHPLLP
jgi:hypothetical protein